MSSDRLRFSRRLARAILVSLSLGAILLSMGAPGVGWVLSSATLIAASVCAHFIGRAWLLACSLLSVALLLTFGPLGYFDSSKFDPNLMMVAFTFGPLAVALIALFLGLSRGKSGP